MPRATADTTKTERFDLKTLPGGFVVLRKMTYGQMMERQELAGDMVMKVDAKAGRNANPDMQVKMMQKAVTEYEFAHCIVEHNLEDENGQMLNFQMKGTFGLLDPQVGGEIADLIDSINQPPEDAHPLGNSNTGSDAS